VVDSCEFHHRTGRVAGAKFVVGIGFAVRMGFVVAAAGFRA
jgi:hypothetical protein